MLGKVERELTYGQVWKNAQNIASHILYKHNLAPGDRVILCYAFSLDFIQV